MRGLLKIAPYLRRHRLALVGGIAAILLSNYFQVEVARIVGLATDTMQAPERATRTFAQYALLIVGFTLLMGAFRFLMRWWMIGASRDIEFDFRNDIFRKLLKLPPRYYDTQRTGDLMSRATNDVDAVRMVVGPAIMQFVNSFAILPLAIWRMLSIDWRLALVCLAPIAAVPVLVNLIGNAVHKRFRLVQDHFAAISAMVQENLSGARVIRAFVQEEAQKRHFAGMSREYIRLNMNLAIVQASLFPSLRLLMGISVVVLLWFGGLLVIRQTITLGMLVEFSLIQTMIYWPLVALGWTISLMQRGAASMERIEEVMRIEPDPDAPSSPAAAPAITHGAIEMRGLNFRYAPGLPLVLHDIQLAIPAGGSLGIVGPTGSGKSTLGSILIRLYPVDEGAVFIDGHDLNHILAAELRDKVSMVFQETFLFSDSIANNIRFGAADADDPSVERAAEEARLSADVKDFPKAYATLLGERGVNLSGGQKQRTALARAIVRDPRILVLDDALSAVDTETEAAIIASLRSIMRGRTTIVIAHRISAVMACDEIIVLDEGRIAERGDHAQLIARGGLYASLYEKQLLVDAVEMEAG